MSKRVFQFHRPYTFQLKRVLCSGQLGSQDVIHFPALGGSPRFARCFGDQSVFMLWFAFFLEGLPKAKFCPYNSVILLQDLEIRI